MAGVIFTDLGRWDSDRHAYREDLTKIGEGRAPGLHLSEVIQSLRQQAGLASGSPPGEPEWLAAQDGFLWEHAMEYYAAGVSIQEAMEYSFKRYMTKAREGVTKQLTTSLAGIHMSPDGYDPATKTLESYKRTKKSMKSIHPNGPAQPASGELFAEVFWPWVIQESCYWLALEAEGYDIQQVEWLIFWCNGNYVRKPYPEGVGQEVHRYRAVISKEERLYAWQKVSEAALKLRNKTQAASSEGA